jgi:hypothetical protein
MSEKLFTVAGVSRGANGVLKARFATDLVTRIKVLQKDQTDIDIIELKEPMTKTAAVEFLLSIDFDDKNGVRNPEVRAALEEALERRTPAPKAAKKEQKGNKEAKKPKKEKPAAAAPTLATIRAKAVPKSTKSKAEITAELAELEDAPF